MDQKTVNWLTEHGYEKYADSPFEKWSKDVGGFTLRIRTVTPTESKLYGVKLSAKAMRKEGSVFDTSFNVFFGDEPERLDEEMRKDILKDRD